jgi:hypothetical protein
VHALRGLKVSDAIGRPSGVEHGGEASHRLCDSLQVNTGCYAPTVDSACPDMPYAAVVQPLYQGGSLFEIKSTPVGWRHGTGAGQPLHMRLCRLVESTTSICAALLALSFRCSAV